MTKIDSTKIVGIGEKLNNGAIVVTNRWISLEEERWEGIVLGVIAESSTPWCVWRRIVSFNTRADGKSKYQTEWMIWGHYFRDFDEAVKCFNDKVEDTTHEKRNIETIRARGEADGKAAASCLVDGNTQRPYDVLKRLADGIGDGDPEILDALPQPRLGGEFADDPTWADILKDELDLPDDDDHEDLLDVYEEAFKEGVEATISGMLHDYDPSANYGRY